MGIEMVDFPAFETRLKTIRSELATMASKVMSTEDTSVIEEAYDALGNCVASLDDFRDFYEAQESLNDDSNSP